MALVLIVTVSLHGGEKRLTAMGSDRQWPSLVMMFPGETRRRMEGEERGERSEREGELRSQTAHRKRGDRRQYGRIERKTNVTVMVDEALCMLTVLTFFVCCFGDGRGIKMILRRVALVIPLTLFICLVCPPPPPPPPLSSTHMGRTPPVTGMAEDMAPVEQHGHNLVNAEEKGDLTWGSGSVPLNGLHQPPHASRNMVDIPSFFLPGYILPRHQHGAPDRSSFVFASEDAQVEARFEETGLRPVMLWRPLPDRFLASDAEGLGLVVEEDRDRLSEVFVPHVVLSLAGIGGGTWVGFSFPFNPFLLLLYVFLYLSLSRLLTRPLSPFHQPRPH